MKSNPTPLHWRAFIALMNRLPKALLSRFFGRLMDIPIPRVLRKLILGCFAKLVGINLKESELGLAEYPNLNGFFVRRLKKGIRPLPESPDAIISPVDGCLAQWGPVVEGKLIQAKGIHYSVSDLVGEDQQACLFQDGMFMTLYLSPKDYHRIHVPCSGALNWASYVPGKFFPVNQPAVALIPDLFARNERLICTLANPMGHIAMVAVGAYNVGRISSRFDESWNQPHGAVTNHPKARKEVRIYQPPLIFNRGDEIMAFHLGSTVVLLFEKGSIEFEPWLQENMAVKMGQPLACFRKPENPE